MWAVLLGGGGDESGAVGGGWWVAALWGSAGHRTTVRVVPRDSAGCRLPEDREVGGAVQGGGCGLVVVGDGTGGVEREDHWAGVGGAQ